MKEFEPNKYEQAAEEAVKDYALWQVKQKLQHIHEQQRHKNKRNGAAGLLAVLLLCGSASLFWLYFKPVPAKKNAIAAKETLTSIKKEDSLVVVSSEQTAPTTSHSAVLATKKQEKTSVVMPLQEPKTAENIESKLLVPQKSTKDTLKMTAVSISPTTTQSVATISCNEIKWKVNYYAQAACQDGKNGNIQLKISGGKPPYEVQLNDELYSTTAQIYITEKAAGSYQLQIKDKQGCKDSIRNITIPTKMCEEHFVLNVSVAETWKIPYEAGKLIIYHKSGTVVFQTELSHFNQAEWNGYTLLGTLAETGLYRFELLQNNQMIKTGTVSVIR